jgi:hypothetical protein
MHEYEDIIARAEQSLVAGEKRLSKQKNLIERLARDGYATQLADSVLELMKMRQANRLAQLVQWRRGLQRMQSALVH